MGPGCTATTITEPSSLAVAGLVAGNTEIDTAESVDVSYPGFIQQMKELGANVEVD